jgi:Cu/Zn superoxide dismutase
MSIERKIKSLALLSLVVIAAIASGILLATQASSAAATTTDLQSNYNTQLAVLTTTTSDTTNATDTITGDTTNIVPGWGRGPMGFGIHGFGGCGGFGQIEVSDEYKTAVTTIAENDTDVKQLLADGYNVTRVLPIVKTVIDAEGNIATTATNVTVVLEKDTTGYAFVSVDLAQDKVTQIVIYTKTVIEK